MTTQPTTLASVIGVPREQLVDLGILLTRIERDAASARALLATIGAPAVAVTTVPAAGSGPATDARAYIASQPTATGYRPVPPPPTAKAQAHADMGLRPDFAATATAVGLGCTPAFVEATLGSIAPNHRNKPGVMCVTCVGILRRKWEQAQRGTTPTAPVTPPPAPQPVAPAPQPVQDVPTTAHMFQHLYETFVKLGMTPQDAAVKAADIASTAQSAGVTATPPAPQAPEAPKAAPVPPPAPQTDKRPYADPQALEANIANIVTPSIAQWVRDVNAARMQGLADPAPPADAKWAQDPARITKLLRRIVAASRA